MQPSLVPNVARKNTRDYFERHDEWCRKKQENHGNALCAGTEAHQLSKQSHCPPHKVLLTGHNKNHVAYTLPSMPSSPAHHNHLTIPQPNQLLEQASQSIHPPPPSPFHKFKSHPPSPQTMPTPFSAPLPAQPRRRSPQRLHLRHHAHIANNLTDRARKAKSIRQSDADGEVPNERGGAC